MNIVYDLFHSALLSTVPLLIVAIGAMMCERSGVTNIALEGIMLIGAFVSVWVIHAIEVAVDNEKIKISTQMILLIGILVGAITGGIFSLLHAFAAISMKSDQIISATALNLFAPAFAIFTARTILGKQSIPFKSVFIISEVPFLSDIPIIGDLLFKNVYSGFYIGILLLIISYIVLYKMRLGLRLRSCGENPHAADSLGINIYKIRYIGVVISGALAGIGGVIFVTSTSNDYNATVAGFGFLALAVLIFGNWRPFVILLAAFFFGLMRAISSSYTAIPMLKGVNIPSQFIEMIPYIATLIVLAFASKNSQAPKAVGQVYDQGKR